jgi:hypothetical protein
VLKLPLYYGNILTHYGMLLVVQRIYPIEFVGLIQESMFRFYLQ